MELLEDNSSPDSTYHSNQPEASARDSPNMRPSIPTTYSLLTTPHSFILSATPLHPTLTTHCPTMTYNQQNTPRPKKLPNL
jgi:hypothetical protein